MTRSTATKESYERLTSIEPVLSRIARLHDFLPDIAYNMLFHAGPPYESSTVIPRPVLNSISAAASYEGLDITEGEIHSGLAEGKIVLRPAQDIGLVTPLAFIASPRTWCIEVADRTYQNRRFLSPLNDGPPPNALRFGTGKAEGKDLLAKLDNAVASDLAQHLKKGTPLIPMFADAIAGGDDLHGHLAALQDRLSDMFDIDNLSTNSIQYITNANQFVLNIVMASAGLMLKGGDNVEGSKMVTACGGNGLVLGYKLASHDDKWLQCPAKPPVGPKFPLFASANPLAAIGDSAVIDVLGFGAANLRFCNTLCDALAEFVDNAFFTETAHDPFIGPHPGFPLPGLRVGLDLERPRTSLGIMLGMVDAEGTRGLIGRGITPWEIING
tara:strand:- start:1097 stop:2251 length:1155 start_codon:yes stop_codon:yes gene_type:complete